MPRRIKSHIQHQHFPHTTSHSTIQKILTTHERNTTRNMAPIATSLHDDPVQTSGGKAKMSSQDIMALEHEYSA